MLGNGTPFPTHVYYSFGRHAIFNPHVYRSADVVVHSYSVGVMRKRIRLGDFGNRTRAVGGYHWIRCTVGVYRAIRLATRKLHPV